MSPVSDNMLDNEKDGNCEADTPEDIIANKTKDLDLNLHHPWPAKSIK